MDELFRDPRRRRIFAIVCLLHGALLWGLFALKHTTTMGSGLDSLQLFVVKTPRAVQTKPETSPSLRSSRHPTHPAVETTSPTAPLPTLPDGSRSPITGPIDWYGELERAASAHSDEATSRNDFGFPHRPPTTADYPQFDWDYARTHRVESLPQGGLLIHLNDNCAMVLSPLPFAVCGVGKRKANGELFKRMRDPKPASPLP